jgi:hypothetical protein
MECVSDRLLYSFKQFRTKAGSGTSDFYGIQTKPLRFDRWIIRLSTKSADNSKVRMEGFYQISWSNSILLYFFAMISIS